MDWPKKEITWIRDKVLYVSIPFTWRLPKVKSMLCQRSFFWNNAVVGGPAVSLMPDYFMGMDHVTAGTEMPGMIQRINPLATKTSSGCVRRCSFCAVPKTEGKLTELKDWPDLPILIDNNLLATSTRHFNRVIDRLKKFDFVDFNQGIDSRLLTDYHANRLAELKRPVIRLALDSMDYQDDWIKAYTTLRIAGHPKSSIRSYALIGFDSDDIEAWKRCEFIESYGIKVLPMWYHALDQMEINTVSEEQEDLGWTDNKRKMIMGYFYRHRFKRERARYYKEAHRNANQQNKDRP